MSTVWVVSSLLAWVVIALLVAVVLSLMRQVGELRGRTESGAGDALWLEAEDERETSGPGSLVAPLTVSAVSAGSGDVDRPEAVTIGGEQPAATLLLFHQPGCPSCEGLDQALAGAVRTHDPPVRALSVIVLDDAEAQTYLRDRTERPLPAMAVSELPPDLQRWTTPALLGISAAGVIRLDGHPRGPEGIGDALGVVTATEDRTDGYPPEVDADSVPVTLTVHRH